MNVRAAATALVLALLGESFFGAAAPAQSGMRLIARIRIATPMSSAIVASSGDGLKIATYEPDDRRLLGGNLLRAFRIADAATGAELRRFSVPAWEKTAQAASLQVDDGHGGFRNVTIDPAGETVKALALDRDGSRLAVLGTHAIALIDAVRGRTLWIRSARADASAVAFSADGTALFASGGATLLERRAVANGARAWTIPASAPPAAMPALSARGLAVDPDGRSIAVGESDGEARLLSASDGATQKVFAQPPGASRSVSSGAVRALAFSASGDRLAVASVFGERVWDVAAARAVGGWLCEAGMDEAHAVAFRGPREIAMACENGIVEVPESGTIGMPLASHDADVLGLASVTGGRLWSWSSDGTVKLWSSDDRLLATFGSLKEAAFSPDGSVLAYSLGDTIVHVISTASRRELATFEYFQTPRSPGPGAGFPTSRVLAVGPDDVTVAGGAFTTTGAIDHQGVAHGMLSAWNASDANQRRYFPGVAPQALAIAPDGRMLATSFGFLDSNDTAWTAAGTGYRAYDWGADREFFVDPCSDRNAAPSWFSAHALPSFAADGTPEIVAEQHACGASGTVVTSRFGRFSATDRTPLALFAGSAPGDDAHVARSNDGAIVVALSPRRFRAWDAASGHQAFDVPAATAAVPAPGHALTLSQHFALTAATLAPQNAGDRDAEAYALRLRSLRDGALLGAHALASSDGFIALAIDANERVAYVATRDTLDVWSLGR